MAKLRKLTVHVNNRVSEAPQAKVPEKSDPVLVVEGRNPTLPARKPPQGDDLKKSWNPFEQEIQDSPKTSMKPLESIDEVLDRLFGPENP